MRVPRARKGQGNVDIEYPEFKKRASRQYDGKCFDEHRKEIETVIQLNYQQYDEGEKYGRTRKAGAAFQNPEVDVGVEWLEARDAVLRAKKEHDRKGAKPHILVINGSPRSDNTCPGEMSKTHRLAQLALHQLQRAGISYEYLDLSRVTSEYGKNIHPCKGCVSTAMPLCHWPCSCYPNHALGQTQDWMSEIYPMWTRAHGVMIITPVHWYSPPSVLKLMMDRMVCADGGNTDYTSTQGKDAHLAKALELKGWDYPNHLQGRMFSVITHGDAEGTYPVKEALCSWLKDLGLVSSGNQAEIDRFIGYYEPYATSHHDLDEDKKMQEEVKVASRILIKAVKGIMGSARNEAYTTEDLAVRQK